MSLEITERGKTVPIDGACECASSFPTSVLTQLPKKEYQTFRYFLLFAAGVTAWWLIYRELNDLANWISFKILHLNAQSSIGSAIQFFLYEVPKVLLLLTLVVFCMGVFRTFFTPERTRRILTGKRKVTGNFLTALLGVVTPFCSCSVVIGIAIGAGIHGYVPEHFLAHIMGKGGWWSVPLAVLIGLPMYSNAAGMIPIVQALSGKGAALATVLAFMNSMGEFPGSMS
jgi:uncharacterized membrane protein YraQ (UPF0718 family)